mgnify:CR=1 FL=1
MTMPSSGALNMGGTSSPVSVAQELGLGLTTTISMDQANVRSLAGVSSTSGTTWSMNALYGKSNAVSYAVTITGNRADYVLAASSVPGYSAGKTTVTITIVNGIVYPTTTGSPAMSFTGFTTGDKIILNISPSSAIKGRGGNGGGGAVGVSYLGNAGSAAISTSCAIETATTSAGYIQGGGGGGGGAGRGNSTIAADACGGGGNGGGRGGGISPYQGGDAGDPIVGNQNSLTPIGGDGGYAPPLVSTSTIGGGGAGWNYRTGATGGAGGSMITVTGSTPKASAGFGGDSGGGGVFGVFNGGGVSVTAGGGAGGAYNTAGSAGNANTSLSAATGSRLSAGGGGGGAGQAGGAGQYRVSTGVSSTLTTFAGGNAGNAIALNGFTFTNRGTTLVVGSVS